jgi:undecaprenyl-diphosphatase
VFPRETDDPEEGRHDMLVSVPANLGYTVLAALVAGESAGLPIPGETALVSAALLVGSGGLSLPIVIGVAAVAAIIGDNIGYWFGRRAGRRALTARRGPWRRHRQHLLDQGEVFFARHGGKAVALGRFVAGVRVVTAVVAGASRMPVGRFMVANAAGALAWAATTVALVVWLGALGAAVALVSGWTLAAAGALFAALKGRRARARVAAGSAQPVAG